MQLAIRLLGFELLTVVLNTDPVEYEDLSPGDCTSYPVGFITNHELPDEAGLPDRWNE